MLTAEPPKLPLPTVGIIRNLPAADYHAIDLASNSRLSEIARSPKHCRYAVENPRKQTPALMLGTAVHAAILEPDAFPDRYCVAGQCEAIKKTNGEKCVHPGVLFSSGQWWCGVHCRGLTADSDGRLIIPNSGGEGRFDLETVRAMREAVANHPAAARLLDGAEFEVSAIFTDADTGCRCKMRADAVNAERRAVLDLKTTEDASEEEFTRTIFNFGYHRQAAMYLHGMATLGQAFEHFVVVAVEKSPPYGVGVYRLTDEAVYAGREQLLPLLQKYKRCHESGDWSEGYGDAVKDISLPAYAWKQIAREG